MKNTLITLALSLLILGSARADVEVSSSPEFVWIATDAQMEKLKPMAPGDKPPVSEATVKRDALQQVKKETGIRDWKPVGCELVEIDNAPGKYIFMVTMIRPEIKTASDGALAVVLQDGTVIPRRAK